MARDQVPPITGLSDRLRDAFSRARRPRQDQPKAEPEPEPSIGAAVTLDLSSMKPDGARVYTRLVAVPETGQWRIQVLDAATDEVVAEMDAAEVEDGGQPGRYGTASAKRSPVTDIGGDDD